MSSSNFLHGSRVANGSTIRALRCQLGLTQLQLAMNIDCSERLIRKMEKSESVSLKNISHLCEFIKSQDIEVRLSDLITNTKSPAEVAKIWFEERIFENSIEADKRWFSNKIVLSEGSHLKLEVLDEFASAGLISIGDVFGKDQVAALMFHGRRDSPKAPNLCGAVWLRVEKGNISQLHVMLDVGIEWSGF